MDSDDHNLDLCGFIHFITLYVGKNHGLTQLYITSYVFLGNVNAGLMDPDTWLGRLP